MKKWMLILIILVVVVLFVGLVYLFFKDGFKICSNDNVKNCDITCLNDSECKFNCGCGALNINEECKSDINTLYCLSEGVKCVENRCEITKRECLKAGQRNEGVLPSYAGGIPNLCCEGLKELDQRIEIDGECTAIVDDMGSICSDCGNSVCEIWENVCNCMEDCKKEITGGVIIKETCIQDGGEWVLEGLLDDLPKNYRCVFNFIDGGNACNNSDECVGDCLVTKVGGNGSCDYSTSISGCYSIIENYRESGLIECID
ncbi:hypothetical protein GOV12_03935 [Candidatus Pacearchaeota archaeon]|nr:hypothetical protein [Candidatus Pacearchaeota archaeon]